MAKIKQPQNVKVKVHNGSLSLNWNKNFAVLTNKSLLRTQKAVDNAVIRLMKPYTPFKYDILEKSATLNTVIGSGEIHQRTPYARYIYYGKVYGPNIPIVENGTVTGWFSPRGKAKHPTGASLEYSKAVHPLAGKMWFERMKADRKDDILKIAAEASGGEAK